MLTCKEASLLASKTMDTQLTWRERLGLTLHLMMCGLCRRYAKDMKKLQAMMWAVGRSSGMLLPEAVKLSESSRQRISRAMDEVLNSRNAP